MEQSLFEFMEDDSLVRDYMYVGDELKFFPKFLRVRGCVNCEISQERKRRTGHEYGFHHELLLGCLGCNEREHDLTHPFYDPVGVVSLANKQDWSLDKREQARDYLLGVQERWGVFYDRAGVSIEDLIVRLKANRTSDFPDLLG